jgi:fructosamine-3-kinase
VIAERLAALLDTGVARVADLGASHEWTLHRAALEDGRDVFVKAADRPAGVFESEAAGLRWLAQSPGGGTAGDAALVPPVLAVDARTLVLPWLDAEPPTPAMAERFGRELAALHTSGAPAFGAGWTGWIAGLLIDNTEGDSWPEWYAHRRLGSILRRASGALGTEGVRLIEQVTNRVGELAGPAEPPSRVHGDLWSGNVLWSGGRARPARPA